MSSSCVSVLLEGRTDFYLLFVLVVAQRRPRRCPRRADPALLYYAFLIQASPLQLFMCYIFPVCQISS